MDSAGRILIMKKYLEQHKNPEFREIYNQKVQELIFYAGAER